MDAPDTIGCRAGTDAGLARGGMWGVLAAMLVIVAAGPALADDIILKRTASIENAQVRLSDVAVLTDGAVAFAEVVVGRVEAGGELNLSLKEIQAALARHGVNLASVNLKGFDVCHISRSAEPASKAKSSEPAAKGLPSQPRDTTAAAAILANPADEIAKDGQWTVREHVLAFLEQWTGTRRDDLRVTFSDRDAKTLDRAMLTERIAIVPGGVNKLGRIPLAIERYSGQKQVATERISIDLARRQLAVVARRAVNKGTTLDAADVEVREVFLERERGPVIRRTDEVVGLVAINPIREGSVIATNDIAPAVLVRKNENIRVRMLTGGLLVQMEGRALDEGGMGQVIPVRNERSHETFLVEISGQSTGTVIAQESAVKSGAKKEKPSAAPDKSPASATRPAAQR